MRNSLLYCSLFLTIFTFSSAISLRSDNGYLHANSGSSSRIQQTNNMTDILNHIENRENIKRSPTFGSFIQVSLMSSTADDDNSANANNTMTEEQKKKEEERKAEEERQAAIRKSQQELAEYRAFAATLGQKLNEFLAQLKAAQDNIWTQFGSNLTQALNQMKTTIDKEYNVSRQFVVNASDSTRQYIEKKKEEIRKGIEEIVLVSNVSLCETRELKILMFFFEQEEDRSKIEEYTADISRLQPKLPPMKSICNEYLDCGTCSANPSCGWCASKDKCIDGDEVGPLNEVCALYNYKICTGFNCGSKTDCASCLQEATCGWCEDQSIGTGTCLERASNYTGCIASDWYHSLGLQVTCPSVDPSSPEGLQKEEKKKAWTQKKKERKETLEKMDELVPEEEKTIVSQQEDIIKWKQEIVERTAHLEYLAKEVEKVEEEIIHCQRDKLIYSMALKKAEGGG